MTQLVQSPPDLYTLIMHSAHLDDQGCPYSIPLDFQESPLLVPSGSLDLSPQGENHNPEENFGTDLPTQSRFGVFENVCGVDMSLPQPNHNFDLEFASAPSEEILPPCDKPSSYAVSAPLISNQIPVANDLCTTNTSVASQPAVCSLTDAFSLGSYHPVFSPCLPSPSQVSDVMDMIDVRNVPCLNSMPGSVAKGFDTEAKAEGLNTFEITDYLGPDLETSPTDRAGEEGHKNLRIDLSWLDDDDQFERDRVRRMIGESIQILSPDRDIWQTAIVTAELCDGRYIIINSDGEVQEVKLNSLLWRKSR